MAGVLAFTAFALLLARVMRAPRGTWRYILGAAALVLAGSQLLPAAHPFRADVAGSAQTLFWLGLALLPVALYAWVLRGVRRRTGAARAAPPARRPVGLVQIADDAALLRDTRAALAEEAAALPDPPATLSLGWRTEEGELAGHGRLRRLGVVVEVEALWVAPGQRRQGIASRLLAALESEARNGGAARAFAAVESWQVPGFFERSGYRVTAARDIGAGHSRAWMEKELT